MMPLFAPPDVKKLEAKGDVKGLIKFLGHEKNPNQLWAAAGALARLGDPRACDPLAAAMREHHEIGAWHLPVALGELGDTRAVGPLIEALESEFSAFDAVRGLVKIGISAVEALGAALNARDQLVRMHAADALGTIGNPRSVELLIGALKDPEKVVRWQAGRSLGTAGDPNAVEALISALDAPEWEVRSAAAEGLGKIRDPRAVEPLIAALADHDWDVPEKAVRRVGHPRFTVADALGKIGDPRAVEPLTTALKDEDSQVRAHAAAALAKLGAPGIAAPSAAVKTPAGSVPAAALLCDAYMSFDNDKALHGWAKQVLRSKSPGLELDPKAQIEAAMGFSGDDDAARAELERLLKSAVATAGADRTPHEVLFFTARSEMPPTKVWCMAAIKPKG